MTHPLIWRRINPGSSGRHATGEFAVAHAGDLEFLWGDWFREDIERTLKEKPTARVRLVARANMKCFGGGFIEGPIENRPIVELYYP